MEESMTKKEAIKILENIINLGSSMLSPKCIEAIKKAAVIFNNNDFEEEKLNRVINQRDKLIEENNKLKDSLSKVINYCQISPSTVFPSDILDMIDKDESYFIHKSDIDILRDHIEFYLDNSGKIQDLMEIVTSAIKIKEAQYINKCAHADYLERKSNDE